MGKEKTGTIKKYMTVIVGAFIFCFGINVFIIPVGLYNDGMSGIYEIISTFLLSIINLPKDIDVYNIINFLLSIPLLIFALKGISRNFFSRMILGIIVQVIFFTVIKIPTMPIIDDILITCLIGGLLTGLGAGIMLNTSC